MLHAHVFGGPADPPLVALHGVKGHGGRWRRFAVGRRVYGLDLRGHGLSTWDPPWTMERFTADVVSTMDGLGLGRVDLAGHSFGGALAVYVARLVPERVGRLVLIDPAVGVRPDIAGQEADQAVAPASHASAEEAAAWQAAAWPGVSDPTIIEEEVADHLVRGDDGRYRFRWRPAAAACVYSELSREAVTPPPSVPTLILRAPRERIVRRHFLKSCAAAGSDVTVVDIDCGHMMLEERPTEVLAAADAFLNPAALNPAAAGPAA
jgi:lipase